MSERPDRDGDDGSDEPVAPAVFVYGTLRPGRVNWRVAAAFCQRHEPASLPGHALYALAYPCVVPVATGEPPESSPTGVRGDLLWLDPSRVSGALAHLDAFEGFVPDDLDRSYYRRIGAEVITSAGARHQVWVYVPGPDLLGDVEDGRRVPGDDWPA